LDKLRLMNKLNGAWNAFKESYAGLSDDAMLEPGITGDWSVKDIIAHVTWWEQEALIHLPVILEGGRPARYSVTYGGIDAFNALRLEQKRPLCLAEVLKTARRDPPPAHRLHPERARGPIDPGNALSPKDQAGHLWSLS
jgi:hypothetical protein